MVDEEKVGSTQVKAYEEKIDQMTRDYLYNLHASGMGPIAVVVLSKAPEVGPGKVHIATMNVEPEVVGMTEDQLHQTIVLGLRGAMQAVIIAHPESFHSPVAEA